MRQMLLAVAGFLVCVQTHAETRNWVFVQSVGGIAIGTPIREADDCFLPVRVDVSGLSAITVKPTMLNSALICERVVAFVESQNIYLSVVTGLVRKPFTPICPSANLGSAKVGTYQVFYRGQGESPFLLGQVRVGL
jgi:hypothetical protein